MDIGYLSGSTVPSDAANSVHVMRMCAAFADAGHDVTLYARRIKGDTRDPWDHYAVGRRFLLERFPVMDLPDGAKVRKIARALNYGRRVASKIRTGSRHDLLYARDLISLIAARRNGVPFVYEAHEPPKNRLHARLEHRLFSSSDFQHLVVISGTLKKRYLDLFDRLDDHNVIVAHDGADPVTEAAGRTGQRPEGVVNVGYVGHLYPGRGLEIILALAERLPRIRFHVVGGRRKEQDALQKAHPNTQVRFHGYLPPGEVLERLQGFDIVLAPYQRQVRLAVGGDTSRWMSPLKIFEYMAAGKAIVASDLPVLREVLKDGENAILVEPDDVGGWEEAILRLVDEPVLRERLGRQASRDLTKEFTWRTRVDRVLGGVVFPKDAAKVSKTV